MIAPKEPKTDGGQSLIGPTLLGTCLLHQRHIRVQVKSILVPLRGHEHEAEAIRVALRLGSLDHAHVRCLVARPSVETLAVAFARHGVTESEAVLREAEATARRVEHRVRWVVQAAMAELGAPQVGPRETPAVGFSCAIATTDALIAEATAAEAPYHDLVIYEPCRGPWRDVLMAPRAVNDPVLQAVLCTAARPVLTGCGKLRDRLPRSIGVASGRGASAARAASAALPLLRRSPLVQVMRVAMASSADEHDPLVEYLARHQIAASLEQQDPGGKSVAATLVTLAIERDLDLLVMGGGRCMAGDGNFCAVAATVLRQAPFPILLGP